MLADEFLVILFAYYKCRASESKDKVFTILEMYSVTLKRVLPRFNYSQTTEMIFHKIALTTIAIFRNLKFLSHTSASSSIKSSLDLPSWVPDWSISSDIAVIDTPLPDCKYHTADNSEAKVEFNPKENYLLVISGIAVNTVTNIALRTPSFQHLFHNSTIFAADSKQYAIYN